MSFDSERRGDNETTPGAMPGGRHWQARGGEDTAHAEFLRQRNGDAAGLAGMGASFQADFSDVQLHQHDGVAESFGAQAVTRGNDIHFAAGRGPEERGLLGHELAHVVQQREGRVATPQGKDAAVVHDAGLEAEADRAGDAAARGELVPAEARGRGGAAVGVAVQCFDGPDEHKKAGDDGAGGREYLWSADPSRQNKQHATEATDSLPTKRTRLPPGPGFEQPSCQPNQFEFRLTHGDIVMLSGDLFDPRETAKDKATGKDVPVKDSLFKLCNTPSKNPGKELFTQDEVIYAIYRENPKDIRFNSICTVEQPGGGPWALYPRLFSEDVKKAVETRYLRLAAENRDHFNQPDETKKGIGGDRDSSGGAYRSLHEKAVLLAYDAGAAGTDAGDAFAHDAAAEHFITDAFSAGHVRTRRGSVMDYWNARYPNFFRTVKDTMVRTVAAALNDQSSAASWFVPEKVDLPLPWIGTSFRTRVRQSIDKMLKGLPDATFGDLMGKIVHDVDNKQGLWVVNDLGDTWKAYGDGHMHEKDADNRTPELTTLAVKLSVQDLEHARVLGAFHAGGPPRKPAEVLADVRDHTEAPAKAGQPKYGAEQLVPRADPDKAQENGVQNTTASSFEDLWNLPVRSDDPRRTYGELFKEGLKPGGAFYNQLHSKGATLSEDESGTNPRAAYMDGFLSPFSKNPKEWLTRILADSE